MDKPAPPFAARLSVIVLFETTGDAALMNSPAPVPDQAAFRAIVLLAIAGAEPERTEIPPPSEPELSLIVLPEIRGELLFDRSSPPPPTVARFPMIALFVTDGALMNK